MNLEKRLKSQKGFTPTNAMVVVAIMMVVILFALVIGKPYIYSVFFNKEVSEITRNCVPKTDEFFISRLKVAADERNFIMKEQDIIIDRSYDQSFLKVKIKYSYLLDIPFYKTKVLKFQTSAYETAQEKKSVRGAGGDEESVDVKQEQKKAKGFLEKLKGMIDIL